MIISISGMPGSGKSSVAEMMAGRLGMKRHYMGGMRREIARKRGMTLGELNKIGEKEEWTDRVVDDYIRKLTEKEDNFIIESRTAFFLIPSSVKIFLKVDTREGARRIHEQMKREGDKRNEGAYGSVEEAEEAMKKRMESDGRRYRKYYGVDIFDMDNYDIVVDTTEMSIEEVADKLTEGIKGMKGKSSKN